ncbi:hypothetical protein D9757_005673 [Collybiopsis confluens]|uniref:Major facilitator superfamily (MFS) profile domain-containing protein n=1 Tax=Collybiopsis confluens TaxID=2823264 RepID=A0A8H5HSN5_9AGAR|nr:hypothetical protein D9757_005673 [Collybiopsis confluens]
MVSPKAPLSTACADTHNRSRTQKPLPVPDDPEKSVDNDKESPPETPKELDYPEGGFHAWLTVFSMLVFVQYAFVIMTGFVYRWLIQFATFGYTNAYGVFNGNWIGSMQLWLVMSCGIVSGRLYDLGYFYHLIIGGSVLLVFCLFMLSLAKPGEFYQIFLAQGVGAGLAIGTLYVPGLAVVSQYFYKRRTLAMAIVASGSGVGAALQSIMLNKLLERFGFQTTLRISAAFIAGILIVGILCARTRFIPNPPKDRNLLQYMRIFFCEPEFIAVVLGTFFELAGMFFPTFFLQLNANQKGIMSKNLAFYLIPVMNASTVIGRIFFPMLVPKIGIFNMVIPCVFVCVLLIFSELAVTSAGGSFAVAVFYGIFFGAYVGMFAPMVGSLAKTDSEIGARMGICFTFCSFGGLIGTPIAGALLTSKNIWWQPTLFAGLSTAAGGLCFIASRYWISRHKGTLKV